MDLDSLMKSRTLESQTSLKNLLLQFQLMVILTTESRRMLQLYKYVHSVYILHSALWLVISNFSFVMFLKLTSNRKGVRIVHFSYDQHELWIFQTIHNCGLIVPCTDYQSHDFTGFTRIITIIKKSLDYKRLYTTHVSCLKHGISPHLCSPNGSPACKQMTRPTLLMPNLLNSKRKCQRSSIVKRQKIYLTVKLSLLTPQILSTRNTFKRFPNIFKSCVSLHWLDTRKIITSLFSKITRGTYTSAVYCSDILFGVFQCPETAQLNRSAIKLLNNTLSTALKPSHMGLRFVSLDTGSATLPVPSDASFLVNITSAHNVNLS